ncbi:hypothetical protein [Roseibium aestuarii]|uniref:Transmembrane protein n=1 Tax=Roseibium aestuarii TaxID=2600299 RepID=A0ABW4K024_9HYPH|nr:hypothetical protein [Roseibium aestuarii]
MQGGRPDLPQDAPEEDLEIDIPTLWIFGPWIVALVVLEALPVFGVECLFGWCVVKSIHWQIIVAGLALGVLVLTAGSVALCLRLLRRG